MLTDEHNEANASSNPEQLPQPNFGDISGAEAAEQPPAQPVPPLEESPIPTQLQQPLVATPEKMTELAGADQEVVEAEHLGSQRPDYAEAQFPTLFPHQIQQPPGQDVTQPEDDRYIRGVGETRDDFGQGESAFQAENGHLGAGAEQQQVLTTEADTMMGRGEAEEEKGGDEVPVYYEYKKEDAVDVGETINKEFEGKHGEIESKQMEEDHSKRMMREQKEFDSKIEDKIELTTLNQAKAPRTNVTTSRQLKEQEITEAGHAPHESVSQFPSTVSYPGNQFQNNLLEIATAEEPGQAFNSSSPTPQNQIAPVIDKDHEGMQVKQTPQSSQHVDIEQGLNEMLQHLEQTVQTYEQKLTSSQAGSKPGTVVAGERGLSEADNHLNAPPGPSPSSQLDGNKQRKLQDIMRRIKDDIGQIKDALDEEKNSVQLVASAPESQASPKPMQRPIELRSRQESRGRRQHSSSQISQLNYLMRGGQKTATIGGSRFVPEADGALTTKRMKTLKSIFDFYSRQHLNIGRHATFEKIEQSLQRMTLGEYMKLVQDFKVLQEYDMLPHDIKNTCTNAFMAVAENKRDIDFFAFKASLYIVFRIEDHEGMILQGDETAAIGKRNAEGEVINKKFTFGDQPPLMITDGKTLGSASKSSRVQMQKLESEHGSNHPLFDLRDKELIEERISSALLLDKPSQVNLIQQGFTVPFHMKDAKRHSPEKQIQPKIVAKTVDLSSIEKEAIRLRIKVMKIERELNRPKVNLEKTEQAYRPIRDTFQRLKLPEEKKLKKALAQSMKELEEFEEKHPAEIRALDQKMINKQKMYSKLETQNSRPRRLENIQEEYSLGAEDVEEGEYLAIKEYQEDQAQQDNGELYTVPEVDSARFQQNTFKKPIEEEVRQNSEDDQDDKTFAVEETENVKEEESNDEESKSKPALQESTPIESVAVLPEDVTSYYTLDALTQVKNYHHLNKIMDLVRDQNKDVMQGSMNQKSPGKQESLNHAMPSRLPSDSIISLDMQNTPVTLPEKRHSIKPPYLYATTTEKTEEQIRSSQHSQPVFQVDPRKSSATAEPNQSFQNPNNISRNEAQDKDQSMFRPSLIGLEDEKGMSEIRINQLLRSNKKTEVTTNQATSLVPEAPQPQPFERMRASRMNLLGLQTQNDQKISQKPSQNAIVPAADNYIATDQKFATKPSASGKHNRENSGLGVSNFGTIQEIDSGDLFAGSQQFQPATQRAPPEPDSALRNGIRLRGGTMKLGGQKSTNQPFKEQTPANQKSGNKSQGKLVAWRGPLDPVRPDMLVGSRDLKPSQSSGLMNPDNLLPNERMAREYLESHRRMQQEQRRLEYQYNRIKDQLDQDQQNYNKYSQPQAAPDPTKASTNQHGIDPNYSLVVPLQDQQKHQGARREKSDGKRGRGINVAAAPLAKDKAAPGGTASINNKRLEKRIYQVSDLKHMGILKKGPNNQSEINLKLPAIDTATTSSHEFPDDTKQYPNSSLPLINSFGTVPAQPMSNRAGLIYGSVDGGPAGARPGQIRGLLPQTLTPLAGASDTASAPVLPLPASARGNSSALAKQPQTTKYAKNQLNGSRQPAQRRNHAENSSRGGQRRAGKDVAPEVGSRTTKSKGAPHQRRTEREEAQSVLVLDSVDTLEKNRMNRQQAASAMQEVYQLGLERNRLNMDQVIRTKPQHLRLSSKEQAMPQYVAPEHQSYIDENPMVDYEYELPRRQGSSNRVIGNSQYVYNNKSLKKNQTALGNELMHHNAQRLDNFSGYMHDDLGEVVFRQNINQSTPHLNTRQQPQTRINRYSQSKQGLQSGTGKPPRQAQPSSTSLGQTMRGTRQAQSYAQLAKNAKIRKNSTINVDDYSQSSQVPRLSISTSMNRRGNTIEDFGGEYEAANLHTGNYSQIYQGQAQGFKPFQASNDPSGILSTNNTSSIQYAKIHGSRVLHDQSQSFSRALGGYSRIQNVAPASQQLLQKQQLKNMRMLANSVEARANYKGQQGKPPIALRGLSQSAMNHSIQVNSQHYNYRDLQ